MLPVQRPEDNQPSMPARPCSGVAFVAAVAGNLQHPHTRMQHALARLMAISRNVFFVQPMPCADSATAHSAYVPHDAAGTPGIAQAASGRPAGSQWPRFLTVSSQ